MKKPIYKKWWFIVIILFVGSAVISGIIEGVKESTAPVTKQEPEEPKKEAPKKDAPKKEKEVKDLKEEDNIIKLDDKLIFGEYTVDMKDVRIYEDEGTNYADISFDWLNQAGDGKKMFMQLSLLDVLQGDKVLKEMSGAWDVQNKNSSRIYFPNAQNGSINVKLTYELDNKDEPITIVFVPLNHLLDEESQKVNVDIK